MPRIHLRPRVFGAMSLQRWSTLVHAVHSYAQHIEKRRATRGRPQGGEASAKQSAGSDAQTPGALTGVRHVQTSQEETKNAVKRRSQRSGEISRNLHLWHTRRRRAQKRNSMRARYGAMAALERRMAHKRAIANILGGPPRGLPFPQRVTSDSQTRV